MLNTYHVHVYRVMKLSYWPIQAECPDEAAAIACDLPTADAASIDDCEGETVAALVDLDGDEEFKQSKTIEFLRVEPKVGAA